MEQKLQYIVDKIGELNIQITEKQAEQCILSREGGTVRQRRKPVSNAAKDQPTGRLTCRTPEI